MSALEGLLLRLGWRSRPRDEVEREIEDEIRLHIEMRIDANIAAGMDERAARADALQRMGDIDAIRLTGRRILADSPPPRRRGGIVDTVRQDVRNALRVLHHSPGFAVTVILVLALGIGATSTIFSVVDATLLRPLPHPDIDRLMDVRIGPPRPGSPRADLVQAWKERSRLFEGLDHWRAFDVTPYTLAGDNGAVSVARQWVGVDFFRMIGVEPMLGRTFAPDDMDGDQSTTVIISHDLWSRHFGADPGVLGETIELVARPRTIIGVMPPGFRIDPLSPAAEVWMVRDYPGTRPPAVNVVARLRPDVSVEQAAAELEGVALGFLADKGEGDEERDEPRVEVTGFGSRGRDAQEANLYRLLALVGFLLMICCANVSGLLLLRAAARQRELSTRLALGAGRWRIARELLAESTLLALLGALAGVLLTVWGVKLFVGLAGSRFGPLENFRVDSRVLGFALAVSLLAGLLSGLMPALRVSATSVMAALTKRPRGWTRRPRRYVGGAFVVLQVALSVVLLIGAGLMINSMVRVWSVDLGFDPEGVATMRIRAQGSAYQLAGPDVFRVMPEVTRFYERLLARLALEPGVESVGLATPDAGANNWNLPFDIVGQVVSSEEPQRRRASYQEIDAGYFRTLRVPLLRGRSFRPEDDGSAPPVAIINQTLADAYFPGEDPLGQFIHADLTDGVVHPDLVGDVPREIVGIVGNMERSGLFAANPNSRIYVPFRQHLAVLPTFGPWGMHVIKDVVVRTPADPAELLGPMQRVVTEVAPSQVAQTAGTMEEEIAGSLATRRFWMRFLSLCAGVAIVLAALGLYAVVAQAVTARTRELGVRMALGAQQAGVRRLILRQALILALMGVGVGTAAAIGFTRLLSRWLYGITPTDPATFVAVGLVLVVVALLASYLPARRATSVDAVVALRQE